jgi:hypothetical protein
MCLRYPAHPHRNLLSEHIANAAIERVRWGGRCVARAPMIVPYCCSLTFLIVERQEGFGHDLGPTRDVFDVAPLLGRVAQTVAAGDE